MIHKLLEEDLSPATNAAIGAKWAELLESTHREMAANILERHLVPLNNSVRDFEVRKIRAFEMAAISSAPKAFRQSSASYYGVEKWIETQDKTVGGKVDRIFNVGGEIVIRDYKTGAILDEGNEEIKKAYSDQMKVYAAILFDSFEIWPQRLELVPLGGPAIEVQFSQLECLQLLGNLKSLLKKINAALSEFLRGNIDLSGIAAKDISWCIDCPYRSQCPIYSHYIKTKPVSTSGAKDVTGKLLAFQQLGNGTFLLVIECPDSTKFYLRNVSHSPNRHPLFRPEPDTYLTVYNVKFNAERSAGAEYSMTTIKTETK